MTQMISPSDLRKRLHDGGELALLDVREDGEFGEGHLLHANPCAYSHLEPRVGQRVPRKTTRIVLVDGGDGISEKAAERLAALGYTDVTILPGGVQGWADAGHVIFKGVNVPCKAFGEVVEHQAGTPRIPPEELTAMAENGVDHVILDGRTPAEFKRMSIPGGTSVPNGELVYRVHDFAPNPDTTIVVNCAGRTRSIIGAQTLINAGLPNKIVALKGGTMGWTLSGYELDHGCDRHYGALSDGAKEIALERASAIKNKLGIEEVSVETVRSWQADPKRSLFLLDVRSAEEFSEGHMSGSVHAPGGQLVQGIDQWAATLGARLILLDDKNNVRAIMTAHWLKQMGWDVSVLAGGVEAHASETGNPKAPTPGMDDIDIPTMSTEDFAAALEAGTAVAVDTDVSWLYRKERLPGAIWGIRPRAAQLAAKLPKGKQVVMYSEHEARAWLLAVDLAKLIDEPIAILRGGREKWRQEGRPLESSPNTPPDEEQLDFLFFVHDRHDGNEQAMRDYLDWEEGLPAQIEQDGDARYQIFMP
jgi:rhodanese-related sulfurtransferase